MRRCKGDLLEKTEEVTEGKKNDLIDKYQKKINFLNLNI